MFIRDEGVPVMEASELYKRSAAMERTRFLWRCFIYLIVFLVSFLFLNTMGTVAAIVLLVSMMVAFVVMEVIFHNHRKTAALERLALKTRVAHHKYMKDDDEEAQWMYYPKAGSPGDLGIFTPRMHQATLADNQVGSWRKDEAVMGLYDVLNGIVRNKGKKFTADDKPDSAAAQAFAVIAKAVEIGAEIPSELQTIKLPGNKTTEAIVLRASTDEDTEQNWLAIDVKTHQTYWPQLSIWKPIAPHKVMEQLENLA